MKKFAFAFLFSLAFMAAYAQDMAQETAQAFGQPAASDEGEVYFIRSTGLIGFGISFKTFLNDELVCRINNNRFSKHGVKAGTHQFAVQYYGRQRKAKNAVEEIVVKPGEKKYIMLYQQYGFVQNKLFAVEITPAVGQKMISDLKEDGKY
jgi:hypothetical protein